MLVFVLTALLCFLYATETIILSYCYRSYAHNPASAKLLLLSEAVKLFIASCLWLTDKETARLRKTHESDAEFPDSCVSQDARVTSKLHKQHQASTTRAWYMECAWTVIAFSVPSLCYFATNNLSFYALTFLSGYQYTLLSDLKILATCLLGCFVLHQHLSRSTVLSLSGLFLGVCTGQYSTMRATAGSIWTLAAGANFLSIGFFVMLVISAVSAVSSVYTEWLMNHSRFRQKSLNVQNMRLYAVGVLLNAAYYWHTGGEFEGFLSDVKGLHWLVVLLLALMGLFTVMLIKHHGNITKVYATSLAGLFAAFGSQLLLQDPPPPLFYAGVCIALAATVQLQQDRSSKSGSTDGAPMFGGRSKSSPRHAHRQQHIFKASMVVPLALAVSLISFVPHMVAWSRETMDRPADAVDAAQDSATSAMLMPANSDDTANLLPPRVTKQRMPALPPFEPTCSVDFADRASVGCLPMNCSLAGTCTVGDKACCAYYNHRMLVDFDNLLQRKGLHGEYALVYGTALGAARNGTILGHAQHINLALSPTALQVLAQNATREEIWRRGYVFWLESDLWRMCPHDLHPAPEFRAAMVHDMTVQQWEEEKNMTAAVYMNGFLMWQKPAGAASCSEHAADPNTAILMQPKSFGGMSISAHEVHSTDQQLRHQEGVELPEAVSGKTFCVQQSVLPIVIKPGVQKAVIAGRQFPAADNLKAHLVNTYGPTWVSPDTTHHGVTQPTPDAKHIQQALLSRLSVTAWGDAPWSVRQQCCAMLQKVAAAQHAATTELFQAMLGAPDMDGDQQHDPGQTALAAGCQRQEGYARQWHQHQHQHQQQQQRAVLKQLAGEAVDGQDLQGRG